MSNLRKSNITKEGTRKRLYEEVNLLFIRVKILKFFEFQIISIVENGNQGAVTEEMKKKVKIYFKLKLFLKIIISDMSSFEEEL